MEHILVLRPKHKSDVQKAIIDKGLDLADFAISDTRSQYNYKLTITTVRYELSDNYFTFDYAGEKPYSVRKPGLNKLTETLENFSGWDKQFAYFKEWLHLLKEDLEAPDWQEVQKRERELLQTSIPASEENDKFTEEEKKVISSKLEEIHSLLVKALEEQKLPDTEHQAKLNQITTEIKYLKEGADRLGKKDWKNTAISAILGLAMSLALSSEARLTLATVVKSLLDFIVHSQILLGF
jgi:hypothetical protein